jgi:hypothetical protein
VARADQPGRSTRARRRTKLILAFRSRPSKEPNGVPIRRNVRLRKQTPIAVAPGYVLAVSYFTAIGRQFGAQALLEPPGGPAGRRCVVFTPEAGVLVYWKPKR